MFVNYDQIHHDETYNHLKLLLLHDQREYVQDHVLRLNVSAKSSFNCRYLAIERAIWATSIE